MIHGLRAHLLEVGLWLNLNKDCPETQISICLSKILFRRAGGAQILSGYSRVSKFCDCGTQYLWVLSLKLVVLSPF